MNAHDPRMRASILEVASYPPPRSGWSVRVEFLKKAIDSAGHRCVVLNVGPSRRIPSSEYDSVRSTTDLLLKLCRYSREGFVVHAHSNGDSVKGALLALVAGLVNVAFGTRPFLTFHAGVIQRYFPKHRAWWMVPCYWLLFTIPRHVICNSEAVKARISGYGISPEKIVPIPAFSRQYVDFQPAPLPPTVQAFFDRFPRVVFTYLRMRPLFYPLTMIDGMARLMTIRNDVGLLLCGGLSHMEEDLWKEVDARIRANGIADRICFIDDLERDAFLSVLQRSSVYLRTPVTDGVASSVLESIALGTPVVASDNGTRPVGAMTYPVEDAIGLAAAVEQALDRPEAVDAGSPGLDIADTLSQEVSLLTGTAPLARAAPEARG
jgi:glycosyltransferase involved in cell wall biosynthesis